MSISEIVKQLTYFQTWYGDVEVTVNKKEILLIEKSTLDKGVQILDSVNILDSTILE